VLYVLTGVRECVWVCHCSAYALAWHSSSKSDTSNLLKLPPKSKKRGRPKGSELTAIGLLKKKQKAGGPTAFIQKHPKEKERGVFV